MKSLLKKYFGYDSFRPLQAEIIDQFTKKNDCLVLMPTGGGKSLCFQIPALHFPGITVVISPLIALMKDQVDGLNAVGIPAVFLNSTLSPLEIQTTMRDISAGEYKLLYIAPERLGNKTFLEWLQRQKVSAFAIDEAHCISQWGHDFRPDYQNLSSIRKNFSTCPIIALTASATPKVTQDIKKNLNLASPKTFTSSFYRKNLNLSVIPKKQMKESIADILEQYKGESAIIYCFSRKETEELATYLSGEGIPTLAYHAGLPQKKREDHQEKFIRDEISIITATIAFGMGVDKPNIRRVFHTVFPKTMEGYYQEIGRAGRDGLESECILFFSEGDRQKHEFFLRMQENKELQEMERKKMNEMLDFARQKKCRWHRIISYFGEIPSFSTCGKCDVCIAAKNTFDATEVSQKILSCMIRTGNKFGKNHILKILKGSKEKNILSFAHDKLPVWGIEKKYTIDELSEIFSYLLADELIHFEQSEYPKYSVSEKGIKFLQNRENIEIPKILITQKDHTLKDALEYNHVCFERLKDLRKFLADKKRVPPFVIFGDVSLQEMSYYLPATPEQFGQITGVGQKKMEEFGDLFIEEIAHVMEEEKISLPKEKKSRVNAPDNISTDRYKKTKQMLGDNNSIQAIAEEQGFQVGTIVNHLEKLLITKEINLAQIEYLKPTEKIFLASRKFFEDLGTQKLKPIFDACDQKISYDQLRLVRLFIINENKENKNPAKS